MSYADINILGLTTQVLKQREEIKRVNLSKTIYDGIDKRFNLVDVRRVALQGSQRYVSLLRNMRPNSHQWKLTETLNPWSFQQRSRVAQQIINEYEGRFDFIFMLHPLFKPGDRSYKYSIFTDNLYAQSLRLWPEWVPAFSDKVHDRMLELQREVLQEAEVIFAWSRYVQQSCIYDYGVSPDKVVISGSTGNLDPKPLTKTDYSQQIALIVGYDFERKGGLILLKAWETVAKKLPNAQLWIVGPDKPVAPSVDSVRWLGRINNAEKLADTFQQATLFVMPSLFEPWGHVFFEAMGAGLPLIGTTVCAMPEFIIPEHNGLLVPPNDSRALADALITILSDPEKAHEMGHRGYQDLIEKYTMDRVAERMAPYIAHAVNTRSTESV